ncbi:MAG: Crp/Fnr family transcriptional regulator [Bacteroidota bacterium]
MEKILIEYFSKFRPLTEAEQDIILKDLEISIVKKGTILLREGDSFQDNYFVIKGCVRQYYLVNGEEKTSNFFTEEEWILPVSSNEDDKLSPYYLECVEECALVVANDQKGNEMLKQFPAFQELSMLILQSEIAKQQAEFARYITNSPEQRYMDVQAKRPKLLQRVPQYQLASYIGVKPESLSRIRKRIANYPRHKK